MKKTETEIPRHAAKALSVLENAGFEAWCVGGCVRDILRCCEPHDWDICTSALPEETLSAFKNFRTIPTGIKHGTITVLIDGEATEITTYRTDGDYLNHRSPEQVQFVRDIRSDLERRDFTMNAICINLRGEIFDPFDGAEDIKNGVIRCVGDPKKRFDEDALRILRAIRFAAKTGFEIEKNTAEAALSMRELLVAVSAERIYAELKALLVQPFAGEILRRYRDIIAQVIPEVKQCFDFPQNNPHHCYDVWEHITRSVDLVRPDEILRTVMLLHDIGKPDKFFTDEDGIAHFKQHPEKSAEYADHILRRLKSDTASRKLICELIAEHDNRVPPEKKQVRRFISKHGYDFYDAWLEIRRADTLAQSMYLREKKVGELDGLEAIGKQLRSEKSCVTVGQLAVDGNDLAALGLKGKQIGEALKFLLEAVMDEQVKNERNELISFAERTCKNG